MGSDFARVIEEHLELKRRNGETPRESDATPTPEPPRPAATQAPTAEAHHEDEDTLWGPAREFDWGE